jgi:hypothetical protein
MRRAGICEYIYNYITFELHEEDGGTVSIIRIMYGKRDVMKEFTYQGNAYKIVSRPGFAAQSVSFHGESVRILRANIIM